jgi:hypothetical protein
MRDVVLLQVIDTALVLPNQLYNSATWDTSHSLPYTQGCLYVLNNYIWPQHSLFKQNTADLEQQTSKIKCLILRCKQPCRRNPGVPEWKIRILERWTVSTWRTKLYIGLVWQVVLCHTGPCNYQRWITTIKTFHKTQIRSGYSWWPRTERWGGMGIQFS